MAVFTHDTLNSSDDNLLFSYSVASNYLWPHGLQHPRPCPSLSPGVCSNSHPLSQWCHPTISSCHSLLLLPSIFPIFNLPNKIKSVTVSIVSPCICHEVMGPSIRVFSSKSALHIRWPKYWSFSLSISLSNEYSGLIYFRMDWFDLLAVQGTLKSLLQHHSSKASIFGAQPSLWSNSHIRTWLLERP